MKKLSTKSWLWIYAIGCFAFCLYYSFDFYTGSYSVNKDNVIQLEQEIDIKKNQLARILAQNQRKGALELEIAQATEEFKILKEMFPDKDYLPKRLQDLTKACRQAGVIPIHFRPMEGLEKEFYMENFYEIKITSGYHGLGRFFAEIANFKYPTGISSVLINQNPKIMNNPNPEELQDESHTTVTQFIFKTFTSKQ